MTGIWEAFSVRVADASATPWTCVRLDVSSPPLTRAPHESPHASVRLLLPPAAYISPCRPRTASARNAGAHGGPDGVRISMRVPRPQADRSARQFRRPRRLPSSTMMASEMGKEERRSLRLKCLDTRAGTWESPSRRFGAGDSSAWPISPLGPSLWPPHASPNDYTSSVGRICRNDTHCCRRRIRRPALTCRPTGAGLASESPKPAAATQATQPTPHPRRRPHTARTAHKTPRSTRRRRGLTFAGVSPTPQGCPADDAGATRAGGGR